MQIEITSKKTKNYECTKCNFICFKKGDYNRHILTAKHNKFENANYFTSKNIALFKCECGKNYKHSSSLSKHKKICVFKREKSNNDIIESQTSTLINNNLENLIVKLITDNNDIKNTLLKENQELKKKLDEKDNTINELIPKIGNTTTNNTINNNKFKIKELPTIFVNRTRGESSVNLKLIIQSLFGLIKLAFIKNRL